MFIALRPYGMGLRGSLGLFGKGYKGVAEAFEKESVVDELVFEFVA